MAVPLFESEESAEHLCCFHCCAAARHDLLCRLMESYRKDAEQHGAVVAFNCEVVSGQVSGAAEHLCTSCGGMSCTIIFYLLSQLPLQMQLQVLCNEKQRLCGGMSRFLWWCYMQAE